jgi:DnaJ-class molecular chaperone
LGAVAVSRSLTTLDCYRLGALRVKLWDDDCYDCQGTGEIEGEAVNRNGPYSIVMDCPTCKGSGKIERDDDE